MGVHFCGWCGGMSGGGFCDYKEEGDTDLTCDEQFDQLYNEVKKSMESDLFKKVERLIGAYGGCD